MEEAIAEIVRRPRLVDLGSASRIVMVQAPSGAGKSTLLAQLAEEHDGPVLRATLSGVSASRGQLLSRLEASVRRRGLSDLSAALGRADEDELVDVLLRWSGPRGERFLLEVDDLHLADEGLVHYLADLCDRLPSPHRVVLAGRRIPARLEQGLVEVDSRLIGPEELRFRPEETRQVLGEAITGMLDETDIALITRQCEGWAAAVGLAGDRLGRHAADPDEVAREASELASRPATVPDLLRELLDGVPERTRDAVRRLALLPALDDHIVRVAGLGGGMADLVSLGLPLEEVDATARVFPNAVRDVLDPVGPDEALARLAAQHYLDESRPHAALEVLAAAGLDEDLAKLLVDFPSHLFGHLDAREYAAAVASVPHHLHVAHPGILVNLADRYTLAGHIEAYAEALSRAEALLVEGGRIDDDQDAVSLEVRASVLARRSVARNDDGLVDDALALLANPSLPPMAAARLTVAVGRSLASRRTSTALRAGARRLDEAVRAFERAQAPIHAIGTRVIAATFALLPLGRYDLALQEFDHALSVARGNVNLRVGILPYRAFALIDLGRYAEAEGHLRELRRTSVAATNARAAIYARWAAARMASQQGDADATWAAVRAVEHSDLPIDTGNGAFFRADAAQLLARVGCFEDAHRLLAEARELDDGATHLVTVAEFVVAAHEGDRPRAEAALQRLEGGRFVEPRDRWRITLLHAHLCLTDSDPATGRLAAAAFEQAAQLGHADLPLVQEPRVAHALRAVAVRGSASARDDTACEDARLRLLGRFDIQVAGRRTEPAGRPAQLLAYLALHDGQAGVATLIEAIWPGADLTRGRERLRTVLRRIRRDFGDLVERHDDLVRLRAVVTVDVHDFSRFVRRALDETADREGAAAAALSLYRGEAVPGLGHLDWVLAARHHLESQLLTAHDVVAETATHDGRLDEAIRSLLAALRIDAVAESRYLAAARLLAEQGRRARALRLLAEGREALAAADLEPGPEFDRFDAYLARRPAIEANA